MTDRTPVNSSALNSYAYDADAGELTIERPNGTLYTYSPVTRATYEEFVAAESKGRYLSGLMRDGCACRRVEHDHGEGR
jgi:hypothetical protein